MADFGRDVIDQLFRSALDEMGLPPEGPWLFSYFFVDIDIDKLTAAARALELEGYRFVTIFHGEETDGSAAMNEDGSVTLFLQMDKTEKHSVDSLMERNEELNRFAGRHGLAAYDGLEIGRADP